MRHSCVEDLRLRLGENLLLRAPAASFKEQAINVGTVLSACLKVVFLGIGHYFKVEIDLINRYHILSGEVLLDTCQEALSEEETGYPEGLRCTVIDPVLHKLETLDEVNDP